MRLEFWRRGRRADGNLSPPNGVCGAFARDEEGASRSRPSVPGFAFTLLFADRFISRPAQVRQCHGCMRPWSTVGGRKLKAVAPARFHANLPNIPNIMNTG